MRIPKLLTVLLAAAILGGCGGSATSRTRTAATGHPRRIYTYSGTTTAARSTTTGATRVLDATPQPSWKPYLGPVPILVYHDLGNAPASEPYPGLYMPYATFAQEMAWLHAQGYTAVTLDELMAAWYHGGTLPAKPIVITFDNGYPPQVTEAPAVMSKYGWPGVLNEITEGHLHPAQIESVLRLGWEVDSHSEVHSNLTTDSPAELHAEVVDSRTFLQRTFHIPSNSFCYPSSKYDATVVAAVRAAGYTNAVTEGNAYATRSDSPFLLPRFEMETGLAELRADLAEPH